MNDIAMSDFVEDATLEEAADDAAWASIQTPFSVEQLTNFLSDIERLYRINPMLEFKSWKATGNNSYSFSGKNISQDPEFEFDVNLTVIKQEHGYFIEYDKGIKSSTELKIEQAETGSTLTITDRYDRLPAEERENHIAEVDKSLVIWAKYLQRFFVMWQRWSKFSLWRWYMRRVWQPMKPTARRITYMLLWISVVEVALILLGVGIYFSEYA